MENRVPQNEGNRLVGGVKFLDGLDSPEQGHCDITDDNVWISGQSCLDKFSARANVADHLECVAQ